MSSSTSTNLTNRKSKAKKEEEEVEFNVIEESPDIATSSSDEQEEEEALLIPFKGLKEGSEEVKERLRHLSRLKVGFRGYLQVLDWYMLTLFFKLMFAFFFTSGVLCLIYTFIVYLWFPEQWFEYFPVKPNINRNIHSEL